MSIFDRIREYEREWSQPAEIHWNHGGPSLRSGTLHVCAVCFVQTEMSFAANGKTHHVNRSGKPSSIDVRLCVKCWSRLLKDEDED